MISISDDTRLIKCRLHHLPLEVKDDYILCSRCEGNMKVLGKLKNMAEDPLLDAVQFNVEVEQILQEHEV